MARNLRGSIDSRLEVFQPIWEGADGLSKTPPSTGFTGRIFYGPAVSEPQEGISYVSSGGVELFPAKHPWLPSLDYNGRGHLLQLPYRLTRSGGDRITVTATGPLGTNTLKIDPATGVIDSWQAALNGRSAVEILNRGSSFTRGIQPWLEWTDAESEGRLVRHRALLGGPYTTRADVQSGSYFLGNPSIEIDVASESMPALNSDGSAKGGNVDVVQIQISGYGMEYDPDGQTGIPGYSTFHGALFPQVAIWRTKLILVLTLNSGGYEGLHYVWCKAVPSFAIKTAYFDCSLGTVVYLNRGAFTAKSIEMIDPGIAGWSGGNWALALGDHLPAFHSPYGNRFENATDTAAASHVFRHFLCLGTDEAASYNDPCVYLFGHATKTLFRGPSSQLGEGNRPSEAVLVQNTGDSDGQDGLNYLACSLRKTHSSRWAPTTRMAVFNGIGSIKVSHWMSVYPRQSDIAAAETDGGLKLAVQAYKSRIL